MDIKLGIKKIKEENNIKGKEIDLNQNKKFETEYLTRDEFIKKQKKKKKKFKPSTLLIPIEEKNTKNDDLNNNYFKNIYINEDEMERLEKIEKLKDENIINENIVFKTLKEDENVTEKNNENNILNFENIPLFIPRKNKKNENKKELKDIKNIIKNNENKIEDNNNKINNSTKETNLQEKEINNNDINNSNIKQIFNDDLGELEEIPTKKGVSLALYIFKQKKLITENETFGRYNDRDYKKDINNNNKNKDKKIFDIEIEYRDEEGKKLKPKEMARYQSYIFHGENAGIRKREKKILRDLKQKRVTNQLNTKTMKLMKNKQNKTNNPFITIQEKNSHFL
jgi:hypothetical protein